MRFEQDTQDPVARVAQLLAAGTGHVHMIGAGGVGMAGLALLLKGRGLQVSGCDLEPGPLGAWLAEQGIAISTGHSAEHVSADTDWLVRSAAVDADAEEPIAARRAAKPVFTRGTVLPALLEGKESVAVAGTHGKTTTAALIAHVLRAAGRDISFCVGGQCPSLGGVAAAGTDPAIVVEADESDGTLALYRPSIAVVTNVDFDHPDHFPDEAAVRSCFQTFVSNAGRVVYCADERNAATLCAGAAAISYGQAAHADYRIEELDQDGYASTFRIVHRGALLGKVQVPLLGIHNIQNTTACVAVAHLLGLPFDRIAAGLVDFQPVARRFERLVDTHELQIVSDYAHHPAELRTVLETVALQRACAARTAGRTVVVFQPHRYSRTLALADAFVKALRDVEKLILLPVYAASEPPRLGGTVWDLYSRFRAQDVSARVLCAGSLPEAEHYLRRDLRPNDCLCVLGAGDVVKVGESLQARLAGLGLDTLDPRAAWERAISSLDLERTVVRRDEPLAPCTHWGVGGSAALFLEIDSDRDLVAVRRWAYNAQVPTTVLGAGSNVLVSDLGVHGLVLRLGDRFAGVREENTHWCCGAALPLGRLLKLATRQGRSGLEFLEGIPGTVGGAVCMNAGAWDREIASCVEWVRCCGADGTFQTLPATALRFAYRTCPQLAGRIAVEVGLRTEPGAPAVIAGRRRAYKAKRARFPRGRCAGSVFKNPAGDTAGRLLEAAGLKGRRVGAAEIARRHANFILARNGATGTDVRALIEIARQTVAWKFEVELETEVVFLG